MVGPWSDLVDLKRPGVARSIRSTRSLYAPGNLHLAARYTREAPHKQGLLPPPMKHRRAYLWSSRAGSINISASLAFNYMIIECLGPSARSSVRACVPFSDRAREGVILMSSRLASWCWLLPFVEKPPSPFDRFDRSNGTCISPLVWPNGKIIKERTARRKANTLIFK